MLRAVKVEWYNILIGEVTFQHNEFVFESRCMDQALQVQCRHVFWALANSYRSVCQYPHSNPIGTYLINSYISYITVKWENIPHWHVVEGHKSHLSYWNRNGPTISQVQQYHRPKQIFATWIFAPSSISSLEQRYIYRVGQLSFSIFQDTLFDQSLLKFIQSTVNWEANNFHFWGTLHGG